MTIQKKSILIYVISIAMVLTVAVSVFVISSQASRENAQRSDVLELIAGVFDLNTLTNDYVVHQSRRAQLQWQAEHEQMARLMTLMTFEDEERVALVESLRADMELLRASFSELVQTQRELVALSFTLEAAVDEVEQQQIQAQMTILNQSKELRSAQIVTRSQDIVATAFVLDAATRRSLEGALQRFNWSILAALSVLLMLFVLSIGGVLSRTVRRIRRMEKEVKHIAQGDLSQRVSVEQNDELTQLARVFNKMTAQLEGSYRRLEQEVDERTQALLDEREQLKQQQDVMLNILEDVEEEKMNVIRQSQKNELILRSMEDGVFVVGRTGVVEFMNKAGKRLLGRSREKMIGTVLHELLHPKLNDVLITSMETLPSIASITSRKIVSAPKGLEFMRKDGTYFAVDLVASPLIVENQVEGAIVVFRDVTRARDVDRMKSEFVSVASHQLRTPLSALRWYAEMLLDGDAGELNAEQKTFVTQLYDSSKRMIDLVNSLLNVSRIESGRIAVNPEPTDLAELLQQTIDTVRVEMEKKKITVVVSVHAKLPKLNIDPRLIREVLMNLLTNAVKYSPEESEIEVFISLKGDDVLVQVSDSGYGIPLSQQKRVFERFFRADNAVAHATDGTGLGLYIAKSIIESSGGKIWFESEENKGTTFWFTIPKSGMVSKKGDRNLIHSEGSNEAS